jgi:hypothetical protein
MGLGHMNNLITQKEGETKNFYECDGGISITFSNTQTPLDISLGNNGRP